MKYREQNQGAQIELVKIGIVTIQVDASKYPETCPECRQPARSETMNAGYPIENELWTFCINPKCVNFDSNIRHERQRAEARAKDAKPFARHQRKQWKAAGYKATAGRGQNV